MNKIRSVPIAHAIITFLKSCFCCFVISLYHLIQKHLHQFRFIARYPILVILLPLSVQDRTDRKTIYVSLLYCHIVRYKENQA